MVKSSTANSGVTIPLLKTAGVVPPSTGAPSLSCRWIAFVTVLRLKFESSPVSCERPSIWAAREASASMASEEPAGVGWLVGRGAPAGADEPGETFAIGPCEARRPTLLLDGLGPPCSGTWANLVLPPATEGTVVVGDRARLPPIDGDSNVPFDVVAELCRARLALRAPRSFTSDPDDGEWSSCGGSEYLCAAAWLLLATLALLPCCCGSGTSPSASDACSCEIAPGSGFSPEPIESSTVASVFSTMRNLSTRFASDCLPLLDETGRGQDSRAGEGEG